MATRGGVATIPAAPTDLRKYLGYAVVATCLIAGLPLWFALNFGARYGALASLASILLSIGIAQVGNRLWQRHPGSRDIVFNDLMLWGYLGRLRAQRGVSEKAKRLGLISENAQSSKLTVDERVRIMKKLAVALEDGDPYTNGHSQRVAHHSYMIAKTMRLPRRQQEKIRLAALLHDVGKLHISKDIINKPGFLNDEEYEVIKTHSAIGAEMVAILDDDDITRMVREHHERLDGTGYPDKLMTAEICLGARIIAVADTFDATSSQRPYRDARPHKESMAILKKESKARLDPAVVDAFTSYYSGRRAVKWWAVGSIAPTHLRELALVFMQRLGTAGVANAAVVGATALALTPVAAARPIVQNDQKPRNERSAVVRQVPEHRGPSAHVAVSTGVASDDHGKSEDRRKDDKAVRRRGPSNNNGNAKGPGKPDKDKGQAEGQPDHSNAGGKDKEDNGKGSEGKPPKDGSEVTDPGSSDGNEAGVGAEPATPEPSAPEPDAPGNSGNAPGHGDDGDSEPVEQPEEPAEPADSANGNGNGNGHDKDDKGK